MDRKDIREFQLAQLDILKALDKFCKANDINYFLVWGTLIGAKRHGGFIPWDPDIDVAMMRKDYDRFCCLAKKSINENYFLEDYLNEKNHISPHALLKLKGSHIIPSAEYSSKYKSKYDGVFIDVFPLDNVPSDIELQKKQLSKIRKIRKIVRLKQAQTHGAATSKIRKLEKNIVSYLLKPISFYFLNNKLEKIFNQYNNDNTDFVGTLCDYDFYPKQTFPRSIFGTGRTMTFESGSFPVPERTEEFLEKSYGDYMTFPPEEERYFYLDKKIDHIEYERTI